MTVEVSIDSRYPYALRWFGSVVPILLPKLLLFLLYSTLITCLHLLAGVSLKIPLLLVQAMGLTISLLLVFRTNTAYDRYWEGRRLWSAAVTQVRCLTRLIWIGVKEKTKDDRLEKRKAINLLIAYMVATKRFLREEYGTDYDDLHDLLEHLPRYRNDSAAQKKKQLEKQVDFDQALRSNLPLEITIYLSAYINRQNNKGNLGPSRYMSLLNGMSALTDVLTNLERILRTPIPLAYSIHLSQAVWLYCLGLPFQIVDLLKWVTIPITVIVAMTFFGIETIGGQIENPFGYDENDLPLDDFCSVIRIEIEMATKNEAAHPHDWIFSETNLNFIRDQQAREEFKGESERKMRKMRMKMLNEQGTSDQSKAPQIHVDQDLGRFDDTSLIIESKDEPAKGA